MNDGDDLYIYLFTYLLHPKAAHNTYKDKEQKLLIHVVALLLSIILVHGFSPDEFYISTVIPIANGCEKYAQEFSIKFNAKKSKIKLLAKFRKSYAGYLAGWNTADSKWMVLMLIQ